MVCWQVVVSSNHNWHNSWGRHYLSTTAQAHFVARHARDHLFQMQMQMQKSNGPISVWFLAHVV